ncbi:MAG: aspartate kinase [Mariniphaga sp.]|nr:aspartate kinase [Mariniphaga sp.]
MSDCIIRFSGNNCNNNSAINELVEYLNSQCSSKFLVLSSIHSIYKLLSDSIINAFEQESEHSPIEKSLTDIFLKITGDDPNQEYQVLAERITNLLHGISLIGDYSPALKDQVLSYSEKLSAHILQYQLQRLGLQTCIILPEDYKFIVSTDYGNASHLSFDIDKLKQLNKDLIYIIPGSYGITSEQKIARAGNSAADYTAASITASLSASELILWGLEKDFFSSDPEIVENPIIIERLTYAEASELAYFDHYSFHPRTVEPLEEKHIPIKIKNIDSKSVSTIINTETFISEQIIKGVAYSDDISLLKLNGPGVGLKPGILAKVTTSLSEAEINVKSVITSQISINFILGRNEGMKALEIINQLGFTSVNKIKIIDDVSLIGIVGHGMQQNYGVSAKLFTAVAENKINVLLSGSGASDLVSYLIVKQSDRNKSIQKIYQAFFNNR